MKAAAALADAHGDAADFCSFPAPRSRLRDWSGCDTLGAPVVRSQRLGTSRGASFLGLVRSSFDEVKAAPGEEPAPAPGEDKETLKEAERHFVVCKHKLPPGEPRACEMATFEACEDKCKEHFTGDPFCFDTCISHCVIGRNIHKEMRVEPNCYMEKIDPGSLEGALPAHKEPGVYDEIYREKDYQW
eukprot:s6576_g3.t1